MKTKAALSKRDREIILHAVKVMSRSGYLANQPLKIIAFIGGLYLRFAFLELDEFKFTKFVFEQMDMLGVLDAIDKIYNQPGFCIADFDFDEEMIQ